MKSQEKILFSIKLLVLAYFVAVLILALNQYRINYINSDGLFLANGKTVGADFSIFYVAGRMFSTAKADLYNYGAQQNELQKLFDYSQSANSSFVFIYPPPIAAFFSLFARMSLLTAYLSWFLISILIYSVSALLILSTVRIDNLSKFIIFLSGLAFLPFIFDCLGAGQLSVVGLAILAGCLIARMKDFQFLEGVLLGLGAYKPPLFVFLGLLVVAQKRWSVVSGAVASVLSLSFLSICLVGWSQFLFYLTLASNYRYGQSLTTNTVFLPNKGIGLFTILSLELTSKSLVYILYLFFLFLAVISVKKLKEKSPELSNVPLLFGLEAAISIFLSIQVVSYDLTLLLPGMFIIMSVLLSSASRFNLVLLLGLILLHFEWVVRSNSLGYETCPYLPYILAVWISILAIAVVKKTRPPLVHYSA